MTRPLAGGAPPGLEAQWDRATVRRGSQTGLAVPPLRWGQGCWYALVRWNGADGQPDYNRQPERVRLSALKRVEEP